VLFRSDLKLQAFFDHFHFNIFHIVKNLMNLSFSNYINDSIAHDFEIKPSYKYFMQGHC